METKPDAKVMTMNFAEMCREASNVAKSRQLERPTVEQSVAVVTAAAAARAKIGRTVAGCYVHVGSVDDDRHDKSNYLADVVAGAELLGLKVSASPAAILTGRTVYARVVVEW